MVQAGWSKRTGRVLIEEACLLIALALLASCASASGAAATSQGMETDGATSTPTPAAYWDLLPLTLQPQGGWKGYWNEELGLSFQYPAVYDELDCGQILLFDKAYDDAAYTVAGLGSIRMRVYEVWAGDLAERAAALQSHPELQLLTAVEPFSIDGVPAFRVVYSVPSEADLEYVKFALTAFADKLYEFQYWRTPVRGECDAPPLSEEAVYEHLLSTFEFAD